MFEFFIVLTIILPTLTPKKVPGPPVTYTIRIYDTGRYSPEACHKAAEQIAEFVTDQTKRRMPFAQSRAEYGCKLSETRTT